ANYCGEYSAALHSNNFYGVQFHPEKSAAVGTRIIQNFINLNS
ncbi:MAG: imidazole glycerol phosphate synthase subunit HisH, partial [Bacteroidota bacterium]